MPFDNPKEQPKVHIRNRRELALIDGMLGLLRTPSNWCKDREEKYGRYCLIGALGKVAADDPYYGRRLILYVGPESVVWNRLKSILDRDPINFNDHYNTHHRDIVSLLTRARASFE